ncbi:hypothetical protein VMT65_18675 [Nocardia sp. CDC153]|nr:hypothetical protein [Nocardia sp. CDC153]MEC3955073.1 hypothetical protein [Nocardia sp. CDC153]
MNRAITTTELKSLLARFADAGSGAEERAQIDAVFGEERLDD